MKEIKKKKLIRKYLEDCYGEFVDSYDTNDTEKHFTEGLEVAQKELKQKIKDLYNAKNSQLKQLRVRKLDKWLQGVEEIRLIAEVKLLNKLLND